MWKRIVFSIAVSNTDDHLRNHAFIMDNRGWRLSPMYDVNPNIYGDTLSLNVTAEDNRMRFDVAADAAESFDIEPKQAEEMIGIIRSVVESNWKMAAKDSGLNHSAIRYMEPAFDMTLK